MTLSSLFSVCIFARLNPRVQGHAGQPVPWPLCDPEFLTLLSPPYSLELGVMRVSAQVKWSGWKNCPPNSQSPNSSCEEEVQKHSPSNSPTECTHTLRITHTVGKIEKQYGRLSRRWIGIDRNTYSGQVSEIFPLRQWLRGCSVISEMDCCLAQPELYSLVSLPLRQIHVDHQYHIYPHPHGWASPVGSDKS